MAISDENGNGFYMPVAPAYMGGYGNSGGGFGNGFGGDWAWIILLLLLGWGNNGWGGNNGGIGGGGGMNGLYPWLNNSNQINDGFQNQLLNDNITSIRDGVFGLSTQLCNCCSDMSQTVQNGFAQAEIAANGRQMANMQQNFALQSQFADCCCENRLGIADLKYTVATENCADRAALSDGVRDIISAQTAATQKILDKLCDQELQAERRDNANLRSELMYARGQASQIEQTAALRAGQIAAVDSLYTRLSNCPVGTVPVFGNQPIFTCPTTVNNSGCGCGCNGGTF